MESDTFYGDFIVKLKWILSCNLIYYVFFINLPDNLHINFTIESP